jgi:hypothetical protein
MDTGTRGVQISWWKVSAGAGGPLLRSQGDGRARRQPVGRLKDDVPQRPHPAVGGARGPVRLE